MSLCNGKSNSTQKYYLRTVFFEFCIKKKHMGKLVWYIMFVIIQPFFIIIKEAWYVKNFETPGFSIKENNGLY